MSRHFESVSNSVVPQEDRSVCNVPWARQREGLRIAPARAPKGSMEKEVTWGLYVEMCGRLSRGKAPGPDGVPNEVLKMMPDRFHRSLHKLSYSMAWWCSCPAVVSLSNSLTIVFQ